MSLILDALRKLDRERLSRRTEPANISIDILRPDLPRAGRSKQLYFAAIFITAVFTAAVTYAVMMRVGPWSKSPPPAAVISPAPSPGATPSPTEAQAQRKSLSPAPVISSSPHPQVAPDTAQAPSFSKASPSVSLNSSSPTQQVTPTPQGMDSVPQSSPLPPVISTSPSQQVASPSPPSEPARDTQGEIGRVPPKLQDSPESSGSTRSPGEQKESQKFVSKEAEIAPGSAKKHAEPPPDRPGASLPSLKLTVIGWHEEPSKRFAFLNGMMIYEGSVIEGVKIVEIFPKRVRYLYNGTHFEIPLD
jgi:hypothetical protein